MGVSLNKNEEFTSSFIVISYSPIGSPLLGIPEGIVFLGFLNEANPIFHFNFWQGCFCTPTPTEVRLGRDVVGSLGRSHGIRG